MRQRDPIDDINAHVAAEAPDLQRARLAQLARELRAQFDGRRIYVSKTAPAERAKPMGR